MTKINIFSKVFPIILFLCLFLCGCTAENPIEQSPPQPDIVSTDKDNYLTADELTYQGITVMVSTVNDMKEKLGEPDEHNTVDDIVVPGYHVYRYGDVEFLCHPNTPELISIIVITGKDSQPITRDIKIGDSFEDTLAKFPQEQDYKEDADGIFYGVFSSLGAGGCATSYGDEGKCISITTQNITPSLKIIFDRGDSISRISIIGESWV